MGNCAVNEAKYSCEEQKISSSQLKAQMHYQRNSISHVDVSKQEKQQEEHNFVVNIKKEDKLKQSFQDSQQKIETLEGGGNNLLQSQEVNKFLNKESQTLPLKQSLLKFIAEEQQLIDSTLSQSQSSLINFCYWCIYCQNSINFQAIQLQCKHTYHVDCLKESLISQVNNQECYLQCVCKNQINMKILKHFKDGQNMMEHLLNNQLNQIFEQKQWQGLKIKSCRKCRFIYINSQPKLKCLCLYKK